MKNVSFPALTLKETLLLCIYKVNLKQNPSVVKIENKKNKNPVKKFQRDFYKM